HHTRSSRHRTRPVRRTRFAPPDLAVHSVATVIRAVRGGRVPMHSWEALEPVILKPAGVVSSRFIEVQVRDFREAAAYVHRLPYGRNTNRSDALAVIREGHGTCSTKHALLRRLALEQDIDIALVIGIYEMNQE